MIINAVAEYLPTQIVTNEVFYDKVGITDHDILQKCGISQRRHCRNGENTNTMAKEAVEKALDILPYPIQEVDLIIGATYTPFDTIATLAHFVQNQYSITAAKCFSISSSCSSFINAMEIADCFFKSKKASKALIVISEHNSAYYNAFDPKSGFLWGDGAAAVFLSNQRYSEKDIEVLDVNTTGLGHIGKSVDAVCLRPSNGGLKMPFGKDVFHYACTYMIKETEQILKRNNLPLSELSWFIPHQANARITEYVGKQLKLNPYSILTNIEHNGNTGSASTPIVLSLNQDKFQKNDLIAISVFGGGYSSGAMLLKKM